MPPPLENVCEYAAPTTPSGIVDGDAEDARDRIRFEVAHAHRDDREGDGGDDGCEQLGNARPCLTACLQHFGVVERLTGSETGGVVGNE